MEVTPDNYLISIGEFADGAKACYIGIVPSDIDYWLAGDVFLKGYFSVWDDEGNTISLAPHIYSNSNIFSDDKPSQTYPPKSTTNPSEDQGKGLTFD